MNKLTEFIEKYKKREITDKKKIENMVYILIMLVILVIGINKIWFPADKDDKNDEIMEKTTIDTNITEEAEKDNLEVKLKNILEKVNGVSNVSVLINYIETKQIQPVYDIMEKETTTNENDIQGGNRNIVEKDYSKQVVYQEKNSEKNIIIQKEEKPKVAGVIVVANFNNDDELKQQIIKAVANIANISEYKVQVLSGT